jgi:hypothetical protein
MKFTGPTGSKERLNGIIGIDGDLSFAVYG